MMIRLKSLALVAGLAFALGACADMNKPAVPGQPASPPAPTKQAESQPMAPKPVDPNSLYARIGGEAAITAAVDDFLGRVAKDRTLNRRFANTDMAKLRKNVIDQLCEATGGPCKYTGKDMTAAHTGMKITNAEFNRFGAHFNATLIKLKVKPKERAELNRIMGGMRAQIVGK
jgi:hemoglobin